jgi:hypothetical protein
MFRILFESLENGRNGRCRVKLIPVAYYDTRLYHQQIRRYVVYGKSFSWDS